MSWGVVRVAVLLLACVTVSVPQSKAPMLVTQTAHPATIICIAFNAEGTLMASGDEAGLVKIWDFKSRRQVRTLFAGTSPVTSLAFDPKSGALATVAGFEDGVELWDLASGAKRKLDGVQPAYGSLAFSPNGNWLIHGGWAGVSAWNLDKSVRILVDSHPVLAVAFTHDGKYMFTGDDDGVLKEWRVPGTDESSWSASSRISKRGGQIYSIAASPDDEFLAIGGATVELWDRGKLQYERSFGKGKIGSRRPAVFSPDGQFLAAPGDPESGPAHPPEDDRPVFENSHLMLWRIDGSEYAALAANGEPMAAIAFHSTESVIAGGANDGAVRFWDFHQRSEIENQTSVVQSVSAVLFLKQKDSLLVSAGNEAVLWDMNRGSLTREFTGHRDLVTSVAASPDGRLVATGSKDGTVRLWSLAKKEPPTEIKSAGPVYALAFSPDGRILAVGGEYADDNRPMSGYIALCSAGLSASPRIWAAHSGVVKSLAFSADGRRLLSGGQSMSFNEKFPPGDSTIRMWDVATAHPDPSFRQSDHNASVAAVAFRPDGSAVLVGRAAFDPSNLAKRFLTISQTETKELNPETGATVKETVTREPPPEESRNDLVFLTVTGQNLHSDPYSGAVSSIAIHPGGRRIATGAMLDTAIPIWDTLTGKIVDKLPGNGSTVNGLGFNWDGTLLASGTVDGVVSVWNFSRKEELARLLRLGNGNWLVVRSDGSFDTNDLDQIEGLQWIFPDAPLQPLPPEVFMRDYFEPRLLSRASAGEVFGKKGPFGKTGDWASLNRTQPDVLKPEKIPEPGAPGMVTVRVRVKSVTSGIQRDSTGRFRQSGVYDLRLFRDGQLVGSVPGVRLTRQDGAGAKDADLTTWRNANQVKSDRPEVERVEPDGTMTVRFEHIPLPRRAGQSHVEFSAYAFNEDRVKSSTASSKFDLDPSVSAQPANAYVITMGVNRTASQAWDLTYAANDAREMSTVVSGALQGTGQFHTVSTIRLISDAAPPKPGEIAATKQNLRAVLDLLAGKHVGNPLRGEIGKAAEIRKAEPEDLILISVSSHGYADPQGVFHFVTADVTESRRITPQLDRDSLSTDDLSDWLRDIDAGELVLIVDACESETTVQSEGFKPGPMGSRGLGQLAYDKGMRVLAASKARESAFERDKIKHGLLTYALVTKGIKEGAADRRSENHVITMGEWLAYAEQEVPKLFAEGEAKGSVAKEAGGKARDVYHGKGKTPPPYQQPILFDFNRRAVDTMIAIIDH